MSPFLYSVITVKTMHLASFFKSENMHFGLKNPRRKFFATYIYVFTENSGISPSNFWYRSFKFLVSVSVSVLLVSVSVSVPQVSVSVFWILAGIGIGIGGIGIAHP